jgi:hypothetical protein
MRSEREDMPSSEKSYRRECGYVLLRHAIRSHVLRDIKAVFCVECM